MKHAIAVAAALLLSSTAGAFAQTPSATKPATKPTAPATQAQAGGTCKAQATTKKLAGAALASFMKKCEQTAASACNKSATDQKLKGAAKTSHTQKCVKDKVGS
jgi:hypothetical protein